MLVPVSPEDIRGDRKTLNEHDFAAKYLGEIPSWASAVLRQMPDRREMGYADGGTKVVGLDRVVGTDNPKYAGSTWLYVFQNLSRTDTLARALQNLDSLQTHLLKEPTDVVLAEVGGEYFIAGEGNHRCVVGRMMGLRTVRAQIVHYSPRKTATPAEPSSRPTLWQRLFGSAQSGT